MITRIVADLIDVWLALATWRRRAADLWLALPGDVIGLTVMRLCGGLRPTRAVPRPNAPAAPPALLVEDPRAALYLDNVPLRPYAQTLGRYILARERLGLPVSDIWHAGFGFKYDIVPATQQGYTTVWVNRQGEARPTDVHETFLVGDMRTLVYLVKGIVA